MAKSTIRFPIRDEVVQLTVDSKKMTSGSVYCIKRNGWCYIHINNARFASDGDSQVIISGCPRALYQVGGVVSSENGSTSLNYDAFWINRTATAIACHIGSGNHGKGHWVSFAYPYVI